MNGSKARELRAAAQRVKDRFYPNFPDSHTRVIYKHMKLRFMALKKEGEE